MKTLNQTTTAIKLFAGLFLIYFLNSCAPCYYAPSAQNVPLLQEKKDFRASGSFKLGGYTMGCDFQGAVAATNHLGIMLNYSYFTGRKSLIDETKLSDSRSNMVEFGLGYYTPLSDKFVFETYGGYGTANIKTSHDSYLEYKGSTVHSWSLFIQPTIGMHKKNVELAYSTRFRMLDINRVEFDYYTNGQPDEDLTDLESLPMSYFMEPAFTFRVGGEYVKYQMQVGFAFPLSNPGNLEFDPFNVNFGLIFSLPGKKKTEPEKAF